MIWYALELLSTYLLEIGLTGVYAVTILTFVGLCSDRLRQKNKEKERIDFEDGIGRRLGPFESVIDAFHSYGGSVQSVALLLRSNVPLLPSVVREALECLPKRHAILRMGVKEIETKERRLPLKCFIEMDEPYSVDFQVRSHQPAQNWEFTIEKELLRPFDTSTAPLWRARMLLEEFEPTEGRYRNAVVLTAHQVIADDTSLIKLCEDFLHLLNSKQSKLSPLEHSSKNNELNTIFPLRPSISDLMKHHLALSQQEKVFLALKRIFNRLILKVMGKPRHQFTGIFPPTSLQDPSAVKKTCILPRHLPKETTTQLARQCKQNKCTVHGAFIAATTIAVSTMLQNGKLRMPMAIPLSFKVNVRRESKPQVSDDELGCFSLDCDFMIPVPVVDVFEESFWKFARNCTYELQNIIGKGKHFSTLKLIHAFHLDLPGQMFKLSKNKKSAGRLDTLISISSNLCQHKFGGVDETSAFECNGVYFAGSGHNFGPVFGNNIVTINEEMWWSVVYYSNVVTEVTACQFADLVFKILKEVAAR